MNESENEPCTSTHVVKHKKDKALNSGDKNIVLNVFNKFCEKLSTFSIDKVMALTLEFIGISVTSVYSRKICKVSSPVKKRKCIKKVLDMTCDESVRSAVHCKIHSFYANNELPTLKSVDSNKY